MRREQPSWKRRLINEHHHHHHHHHHISNSIEPINFVLGTNTQQYNVHLIIKMKGPERTMKVTGEGQRSQKMN